METSPHPQDSPPEDLALIEEITSLIARLSRAKTQKEVTTIVSAVARRISAADGATIVLRDDTSNNQITEAGSSPLREGRRFPIEETIAAYCMEERKPVVVPDVTEDDRIPREASRKTFVKSLLLVPIDHKHPVGAIGVYWSHHHHATEAQIRVLQSLASSVSVALKDIVLRASMESLIEERTQAIQAVNAELETFAYTVAHDLKNPLSIVKTNTWTLRELLGGELSPNARQCVDRVENAANRMRDQITGMLAMYSLTKDDLTPVTIDLTAMAGSVLSDLQNNEPEHQVTTTVDEDLTTLGDESLMMVVVENLLCNAWKYSSREEHPTIHFGKTSSSSGENVFFVSDNGVGFKMKLADQVFRLFQRLHSGSEFQGTGIGLASAQRIINKHGGRIWVEAKEGEGATFFFTLPEVPIVPEAESS